MMKIISRPQFEYQLCERNNGKKFIKVLMQINDADGFVEVARINLTKSHWTDNDYTNVEEIYHELSSNANVIELLAKTQPMILTKFPN